MARSPPGGAAQYLGSRACVAWDTHGQARDARCKDSLGQLQQVMASRQMQERARAQFEALVPSANGKVEEVVDLLSQLGGGAARRPARRQPADLSPGASSYLERAARFAEGIRSLRSPFMESDQHRRVSSEGWRLLEARVFLLAAAPGEEGDAFRKGWEESGWFYTGRWLGADPEGEALCRRLTRIGNDAIDMRGELHRDGARQDR